MTWYTASVITAIVTTDSQQELVPVFEDFFLIHAEQRSEALQKAELIGKEHASINDDITLNDKPARRIYLGVRKLRSIYNPEPYEIDLDSPVDGTELTHSYFEVRNIAEAELLAQGDAINVTYIDDANL